MATIVQNDVEAAGEGDDELLQLLVGVPATLAPAGYVVEVVDAPDVEGHMKATLEEGQIAARILDARQLDRVAQVEPVARPRRDGRLLTLRRLRIQR